MKKLYSFGLSREIEVDVPVEGTNEKGEKTTTVSKQKKSVERKFFLRRPSRSMYDEAEMFYASKKAECVRRGLLTRVELSKRFSNDGGVFSEPEKKRISGLYAILLERQAEYQKCNLIEIEKRTDEEKNKILELEKEMAGISQEIQEYEVAQAGLYDQTAENISRAKTILWWLLHLSYEENEKGEEKPFFGEGTFEERLAKHDAIEEEENEFLNSVARRLSFCTSFWFVGRAEKQEQFEELVNGAKGDLKI